MAVASSTSGAPVEVTAWRNRIDTALRSLVPETNPAGLYEPVRYVLDSGGKRLRPTLLLLAARTFDVDPEDALPAALAVEVFHNFTLVHDDIMDHADERRGRPTVHVKWDESTAILCGDFLMGLSFSLLARSPGASIGRLVERFQQMTARLCEGQALDKEFEQRLDVSVEEYLGMVDRKTGELLQSSLELGGLLGGAPEEQLEVLRDVGRSAGRAYQLMDDLLDITAKDARWGKAVGGDLVEGKKTYLLLRSLERSDEADRLWLSQIIKKNGLAPSLVTEARERMRRSGVLEEAREEVLRYSREAVEASGRLPASPAVDTLRWLLRTMQQRLH